jgi:hypothetical protein
LDGFVYFETKKVTFDGEYFIATDGWHCGHSINIRCKEKEIDIYVYLDDVPFFQKIIMDKIKEEKRNQKKEVLETNPEMANEIEQKIKATG